mmetsp:Transcript_41/g.63  ORF Transcript_41/g.63 Transcript_41/m.63 type:complete len:290 (+) Transcript_41:357-1226(+)
MDFFRNRSESSNTQGSSSRLSLRRRKAETTAPPNANSPKPEVLGGGPEGQSTLERQRRLTMSSSRSLQGSLSRSRSESESMVRSGFLQKKGVINLVFRTRWFVLTTKALMYFEDKPASKNSTPTGSISLHQIDRVLVKTDQRERFNIVTPTRIFKIKASSPSEADAWVAAIKGGIQMERQSSRTRRLSLSPLDQIMMEGSSFHAESRVHPVADLHSWPTWSIYDVAAWLGTFGYSAVGVKFYKANISGSNLPDLDAAALTKVGVAKPADQQAILTKIHALVKRNKPHTM